MTSTEKRGASALMTLRSWAPWRSGEGSAAIPTKRSLGTFNACAPGQVVILAWPVHREAHSETAHRVFARSSYVGLRWGFDARHGARFSARGREPRGTGVACEIGR